MFFPALVAVLHLNMFLHLDGQLTDRYGLISQSYVAALSTFLVNSFATCLAISLGLAFTQYLWRLFRTHPMTAGTVEALYNLQSSPLSLLTWATWTVAPVICLMALTILLLAAAKPFPPGALTVEARDSIKHVNRTVPSFQPSYIGTRRQFLLEPIPLRPTAPTIRCGNRCTPAPSAP